MSLLLLLGGGRDASSSDEPTVPVLPAADPRTATSLIWVPDLTARLIRQVQRGGDWSEVSSRALEEMVAELFDGFGYQVELTKRTRDGGRDVIAIRHSSVKDDKYLIECKHWEDKVGVSVVRELLGVGTVEPNSGLILVSTSGFTADAKVLSEAEQVRWTLSLKDKESIEQWIWEYAALRGWVPSTS